MSRRPSAQIGAIVPRRLGAQIDTARRQRRRWCLAALALAAAAGATRAAPAAAQDAQDTPRGVPQLVALAPAPGPPGPGDDARRAVAIGAAGEVYEPDGKGAWVRRQRITTASAISAAARAGDAVVALGEGVVYRLAPNGWSAIRLAQKDKAKLAGGAAAVAAVGRQLLALDRLAGGEPAKLGTVPGPILQVGAGKSIVIATDRGLFRLTGQALTPIAAPRRARQLVGDQWAIVDGGAAELRTGKTTAWPGGTTVEAAAVGPDDRLIVIARITGKLELLAVRAGKLERAPMDAVGGGVPVGVAADRAGRVVVAFRDGRIAVRDGGAWTTVSVGEALPPPRPGAPPAASR
ncbi:MAG TPA: hypothetical protein VNO30_17440 [Kofleriaceae bacterium]|nr:hypothetical protein [Kofleriaceae bacterium]